MYPTDTVYGIGADPYNETALLRVQRAKHRLESKPLLLITYSVESVRSIVENIPPAAIPLIKEFWPGPLTLILPARPGMSTLITQNSGTVGVRIPANALSLRLTELYGGPIISTSANITGEPTPASLDEIVRTLGDGVDLYLDAGLLPLSGPSTLIDMTVTPPRILRGGAVTRNQLRTVLPEIQD